MVAAASALAGVAVVVQHEPVHAAAPTRSDYTYTALPAGFFPGFPLDDGTTISAENENPYEVWQHGSVTTLGAPPTPAGYTAHQVLARINASGTIVGEVEFFDDANDGQTSTREGEVWAPSGYTEPPTTFTLTDTTVPAAGGHGVTSTTQDLVGQNDVGQLALGTSVSGGTTSAQISDANGVNSRTVPGVSAIELLGDTSFVGFNTAGSPVVGTLGTFVLTPLDFTPYALSSNGWIAGAKGTKPVLRSPAGVETTLPFTGIPSSVDNAGDVVGTDSTLGNYATYVPYGATTATPIATLLPAGTPTSVAAGGISPHGVIASDYASGPHAYQGFELIPDAGQLTVSGITLNPADPTVRDTSVTATVSVRDDFSDAVSAVVPTLTSADPSALVVTSGPKPASDRSLGAGGTATFTYVLTPKKPTTVTLTATATAKESDGTAAAAPAKRVVDLAQATFAVSVTATPAQLRLVLDSSGNPVPQKITVTTTVKNTGVNAAESVVVGALTITSTRPRTTAVPVTPAAGSTGQATVGDIAAGSTATVKRTLTVADSGSFSLADTARDLDGDQGKGSGPLSATRLCAGGQPVGITSVTATTAAPHGAQVDKPVLIKGCGLDETTTAMFGNEKAAVSLSGADLSQDGTAATIGLPLTATTGTVTLTQGAVSVKSADPLTVDSFRNTDAFSFPNFESPSYPGYLVKAYPGEDVLKGPVSGVPTRSDLTPMFAELYAIHGLTEQGRCWGLAYLSSRFAEGTEQPSTYTFSAKQGYDLDQYALQAAASIDWWKQFADQFDGYLLNAPAMPADLLNQLREEFDGDGFAHPVMVSIKLHTTQVVDGLRVPVVEGHEVVAFGVTANDDGSFVIHTANSNLPFSSAEDGSGQIHANALALSNITVSPNGFYRMSSPNWYGPIVNLAAVPVSAVDGHLTLNDFAHVTGAINAGTSLDALTDASGHAVNLSENSPAGAYLSDVDTADTASTAGPAASRLILPDQTHTETLFSDHPIASLLATPGDSAFLQTGEGTIAFRFDPTTNTATTFPADTGQLTANLTGGPGGAAQVAVTGPSAAGLAVTLDRTGQGATLQAQRAATFTVRLTRPDGTLVTASLSLAAGQTVQVGAASSAASGASGTAGVAPSAGLPFTGFNALASTVAALVLLVGGSLLRVASRRRPTRR